MDSPNRINQTAFTATVQRQTPKNEFGQVLSNTVNGALKAGSALVGALPGMPAVSAAVSSVQAFASSGPAVSGTSGASYAATGITSIGGGGNAAAYGGLAGTGGGTGASSGASASGHEFNDPSVKEMAAMSKYYLQVQNEMQAESRAFNSVTNILKVRHDSAKAAINNIR